MEFSITPQQTGSGIAQPAKVTYRLKQGAWTTQVGRLGSAAPVLTRWQLVPACGANQAVQPSCGM